MKMFITPDKTFSISLEWDEEARAFVAIPPSATEPVFDLVTPTEKQMHEQFTAVYGMPRGDGDFTHVHTLIWGDKDSRDPKEAKGLCRAVRNRPAGMAPSTSLTLALARAIREEMGVSAPIRPRTQEGAQSTEGNSGLPSASGSDSSSSPASSAPPTQG